MEWNSRNWSAETGDVLWCRSTVALVSNSAQFKCDSLLDWQPVQTVTHGSGDTGPCWQSEYQSSSRPHNRLKLTDYCCRSIGQYSVAVIKSAMDERTN